MLTLFALVLDIWYSVCSWYPISEHETVDGSRYIPSTVAFHLKLFEFVISLDLIQLTYISRKFYWTEMNFVNTNLAVDLQKVCTQI